MISWYMIYSVPTTSPVRIPVMKEKKPNQFKVMRSRIRYSTYDRLSEIAQQESEKSGRQVYVADLVREAVRSYIKNHYTIKTTLDGKDSYHG